MANDEIKKICHCDLCGEYVGLHKIIFAKRNFCVCQECYDEKRKGSEKNKEDADKYVDFDKLHEEYLEKVSDEILEEANIEKSVIPTPQEIVNYLNRFVVGQEEAKKKLSVVVYNHMKRVSKESNINIPKSNILLLGPTGSGKTYLLSKIAKFVDDTMPLHIVDASSLTEVGYKGSNPDTIISGLYYAADFDIEKAEKGIVFLDEFDKLSLRYELSKGENSLHATGLQRQLLKILEGTKIKVYKDGNSRTGTEVYIDTSNILFVCGGAFVGLQKKEVIPMQRRIGFSMGDDSVFTEKENHKLTAEDVIDYGFLPEIVGRLPNFIELEELNEKDMFSILTTSKDSILKSYIELLKEDGVELVFEEEAIREIGIMAYNRKVGARGISSILEALMQPLMYEIPTDSNIKKCVITRDVVRGDLSPIIFREEIDIV